MESSGIAAQKNAFQQLNKLSIKSFLISQKLNPIKQGCRSGQTTKIGPDGTASRAVGLVPTKVQILTPAI